mmetsp:Transcript_32089/g.75316  ORF Transcript_32089/g.75316 Transcript_32089/m.75316 type:complete len:425 (+) Transcript_32089:45-1319(+)
MAQCREAVQSITMLLRTMKSNALNPDVQIGSLKSLIETVKATQESQPLFEEFEEAGGIVAILSAMTLHPSTPGLQELAMSLVLDTILHWKTRKAIDAFWDQGGLLVVLSAFRSSLATESLQSMACELLGDFALLGKGEELMSAMVPEAILAWMDSNPDQVDIQNDGVTFLGKLAQNVDEGMWQMLLDNGCIKAMFAFASKAFKNSSVDFDDDIKPVLVKFVRSERLQDQVVRTMNDFALDMLLTNLERVGDSENSSMVPVLRAVAKASSTNMQLRSLLREAGVFDKLVQCLKAKGEESEDDEDDDLGVVHDTVLAVSELAESCEDVLGDPELAKKLDWFFFFNVSLISGRSTAVILHPYAGEDTLIAVALRKLRLNNRQADEARLLLGNEALPSGFVRNWGLDSGKIHNVQLVCTKRRRLTDTE